jgi:8-oxo-dGTP pyrophosphatase MutT (NUDIX family)
MDSEIGGRRRFRLQIVPMQPWRQLSSKTLIHDRWISLRADRCALASGLIVEPYYVIEDRDWVHVFAQDDLGRILIVRQYRYAAGAFCAELPGGVIDEGESPLESARRELLEETGHTAAEWALVGQCFANPARQTNRVHLFAARGLRLESPQKLDESEEIACSFATIAEVKAMIAREEFSQSLHIASFYMALEAQP